MKYDTSQTADIFCNPNAYLDLEQWHAKVAVLRRAGAVHYVCAEGVKPFWAVVSHAEIMEIERQSDKFHTTWNFILSPDPPPPRPNHKPLTAMVGEEHRNHRQALNNWFRPANLRNLLESAVLELAKLAVDEMHSLGGKCDFRTDVAAHYPMRVIARAMQLSAQDEELLLGLGNLFANQDPEFAIDRNVVQAFIHEVEQRLLEIVNQRRRKTGNDVVSAVAVSLINGIPMDDMVAVSLCFGLASAGHHTTAAVLAGGVELLLRNPDQLELLKARPDLIENAVEEILRRVSPTYHFLRTAQEDCILAGVRIAAGERLLLSFPAGNHDDQIFEDPMRFDIERENANRHVAFGAGAHFCVGAHLARIELRAFFREFLSRLEFAELEGQAQYTASTFVGGIKHLPIRFSVRS